jgi:hypothetical protein
MARELPYPLRSLLKWLMSYDRPTTSHIAMKTSVEALETEDETTKCFS